MPRRLQARAGKSTQRRSKPSRSRSALAVVTGPQSQRSDSALARGRTGNLFLQESLQNPQVPGHQLRGKDATRTALLLNLQQTFGNRAVQRILKRGVPDALTVVDNASPQSTGSSPGDEAVRLSQRDEPAVHRLSLSDLNPIEAAKKLAESAWGAIKSLGSSAWDTAQDLGSSAWNAAKSAGSSAWDGIKEAGGLMWNTVQNLGSNAWNSAKNLGSRAWSLVRDSGSRAWNWAKEKGSQVWSTAKSLGGQAWNWAKSFGGNVWSSAKTLGSGLWNTAKSWGSRAWGAVKGGVGKAWSSIKALGGKAWQAVKGAASKAWQTAQNWGGKIWNFAKSIGSKLTLENLCKAVGALAAKAYAAVAPYVAKAWAAVKKLGSEAWDFAKKWGGKLWDGVKSWVGKIEDLAKKALAKAVSEVKNLAGRAWASAKNLGNKLLDGAKRLGTKAWDFAKRMGTRAWDGAKALAGKLWDSAKSLGAKAIDTAKRLGEAVWEKAKALGGSIYDRAKDAAGKLLGLADKLTGGMASKVADLANKVLAKASGLLAWVLNKARDLASRALETAKSWASKALETAKSWASKAFDAAKNAASKAWDAAKSLAARAWDTAKDWASRAWETAKSWGSKAISTAEMWASKAWVTAKSLAGKAWDTAKTWAGKAWDFTKTWAGKAWDTIQEYSGKVWSIAKSIGGKAWDYAKTFGGKAMGFAKSMAARGWNWVKNQGQKALETAKKAKNALMKRLQSAFDIAKSAGKYLLQVLIAGTPAGIPIVAIDAAIKTVACVTGKGAGDFSFAGLVDKVLKFAPFIRSVVEAVKNPDATLMPMVAGIAGKLEREMPAKALDAGRQQLQQRGGAAKATATHALAGAGRAVPASTVRRSAPAKATAAQTRTTTTASEIWSGFVRQITAKWAAVNVWQMVKDMFWTLLWPWPAIGKELSGLWSDVKESISSLFAVRNVIDDPLGALHDLWTNLLHLLDIPLAIWRRVNNIASDLMGWVTIALVVLGAVGGSTAGGVIGGILGGLASAGVALPAGAAAGAGAGGGAGALAGFAAAMGIGEVLLASFVSAEATNIGKKVLDLFTGELTAEEKENEYSQIGDSLIGIGVAGALVLLSWIGSKLASAIKGVVQRIRGPRAEGPDVRPPDGKPDVDPSTGKKIAAEEPTPDGHKIKVTDDGEVLFCTNPCPRLRTEFADVINDPNPRFDKIRTDLDAADKIVDPTAKAIAEVEIEKRLAEARLWRRLSVERGKSTPGTQSEADSVLQALQEGRITSLGELDRPSRAAGESDHDFVFRDKRGRVAGYVEIKTAIDPSRFPTPPPRGIPLTEQAANVANDVLHYGKDVQVVIDLKNLSATDKVTYLAELQKKGLSLSPPVTVLNR